MKDMIKFSLLTAIVSIAMLNFTSCEKDNPEDDGENGIPAKVTYKGKAQDGNEYTLKILDIIATYAGGEAMAGDSYVLSVKAGGNVKTAKGTISDVFGTIFLLAPSNAPNETFNVMVSDSEISSIAGTITFTDNSTIAAPGTFKIGSDKQYTDSRGNKVVIPGGAASCVVRVVSFTHGSPWTSDPYSMDQNLILGEPDYEKARGSETNTLTLGLGGVIILEFGVYFTDGPGNDIYVFENGPDIEKTKVEISADLRTWIDAGNADGALSGVDFAGKIPAGGKYKYVRLTDLKTYPNNTTWGGADVDAVAIMHPTLK
jgi:hypothetical protein